MSVKSFWSVLLAICGVLIFVVRLSIQVSYLQDQMRAVNVKLVDLDRIARLEARVDTIKENGTDGMKALALDVGKLRHDFDVHVAETLPKPIR